MRTRAAAMISSGPGPPAIMRPPYNSCTLTTLELQRYNCWMITTDGPRPGRPLIGSLLKRLDRLIEDRFHHTLGARGITRRQWQLLRTLAGGPATPDALTDAVSPFLDRAAGETARQHLDPLVRQGLVSQENGTCALTDTGGELFRHLATEVQATRALTTAGLDEREYERTIASLETMIRNLETSR